MARPSGREKPWTVALPIDGPELYFPLRQPTYNMDESRAFGNDREHLIAARIFWRHGEHEQLSDTRVRHA